MPEGTDRRVGVAGCVAERLEFGDARFGEVIGFDSHFGLDHLPRLKPYDLVFGVESILRALKNQVVALAVRVNPQHHDFRIPREPDWLGMDVFDRYRHRQNLANGDRFDGRKDGQFDSLHRFAFYHRAQRDGDVFGRHGAAAGQEKYGHHERQTYVQLLQCMILFYYKTA